MFRSRASALSPSAVELLPVARDSLPTAVEFSPSASAKLPTAIAEAFIASANLPIAIEELPTASASTPIAIAESSGNTPSESRILTGLPEVALVPIARLPVPNA